MPHSQITDQLMAPRGRDTRTLLVTPTYLDISTYFQLNEYDQEMSHLHI